MRFLVFLLVVGYANANVSNSCELLVLNNKNIHIVCQNQLNQSNIRIYEKKSPNRTVIALPKNWKLKYEKNPFFEIKYLKNAYYIVLKKSVAPRIETEFRANHLSIRQPSMNEFCEFAKVNKAPFVIVVDPGHGGHDPGTVIKGFKEKNVSLNFSKTLKSSFEKIHSPIKVILTRYDDRFLSLDSRRNIAQKNNADLFISIHADGSPNDAARGLSIFTLSNAGASSTMARLIADKENKAPIRAKKALLSFDREININRSRELSQSLLNHLSQSVSLHTNQPEYANFSVLRSLNMPSCLIEVGFLSNDEDRNLLIEPFYQKFLANQIAVSITKFFNPQKSEIKKVCRTKKENHWINVKPGDNLTKLSKKYHISIKALKQINNLKSDTLKKNQRLFLS